nr:MAG TPA: Single strand binding protein [Bacteriophage sp.]
MAINTVSITGNLVDAPKLYGEGEKSVMRFAVAVNDRVKNGDNWETRPNFVDCVTFGNRAAGLSKWLDKGMKVSVQGKLHQNKWKAEDGTTRSKLEIIVHELDAMQKAKQAASTEQAPQYEGYPAGEMPF